MILLTLIYLGSSFTSNRAPNRTRPLRCPVDVAVVEERVEVEARHALQRHEVLEAVRRARAVAVDAENGAAIHFATNEVLRQVPTIQSRADRKQVANVEDVATRTCRRR